VYRFWLCAIAVLLYSNAIAQSCCSVSSGNNWNILPNVQQSILGVRYSYKQYYSIYPESLNPELSGNRADELIHTVDVSGRFRVHPRVQLMFNLPYSFLMRTDETKTAYQYGFNDMQFNAQIAVIKPRCIKRVKHYWNIGTGIKLPLGKFTMDKSRLFTTSLQLGTGSVDFNLHSNYNLQFPKWSVNWLSAVRLNTTNPQGYRFGHRIQNTVAAYYKINYKNATVMPHAGLATDIAFFNRLNGVEQTYTGGIYLSGVAGLDVVHNKWSLSLVTYPTILNHLNWSGEMRNRVNAELGFYYKIFKTN
jgi:hypothetical protein